MLPPPYSESQGAYYFLGPSQDNGAIISATSGLRPLPVYFSSVCCHWCVLSWPLGTSVSHPLGSSLSGCPPFEVFSIFLGLHCLICLCLSPSTSVQACWYPQNYLGIGVPPGLSHMLSSSHLIILELFSPSQVRVRMSHSAVPPPLFSKLLSLLPPPLSLGMGFGENVSGGRELDILCGLSNRGKEIFQKERGRLDFWQNFLKN